MSSVGVYVGQSLSQYGFPGGHPFGPERLEAFWREAQRRRLDQRVQLRAPVTATRAEIDRFHQPAYVDLVRRLSADGVGYLDHGDTPAFVGCFEAAATVVGSTLDAVDAIMRGEIKRAFVPIAGLHHAMRERAGGFCIFNDCGAAIEALRARHGVRRVLYVDIDAHHGDGVYYSFIKDPDLLVADIHEDGRFLFPGTGSAEEQGRGEARGTKLNLPLLPGAADPQFEEAWQRVLWFVEDAAPEFVILQAGADGLRGDPLTHLAFTTRAHHLATRDLRRLADQRARGRLLALGGGGYSHDNLAAAWCTVVEELLAEERDVSE